MRVVLFVLLAWVTVSIPFALLVGRIVRIGDLRTNPYALGEAEDLPRLADGEPRLNMAVRPT